MKKGFTLIELLVVVLIIGILSAVALPQYQTAVDKTRFSSLLATVKTLRDAEEVYFMANGNYTSKYSDLDVSAPEGCVISADDKTADCKNEYFILNGTGNGYQVIGSSKVIRNAVVFNAYAEHDMQCFAYGGATRADRLCKAVGGKLYAQPEHGCGQGVCHVYLLN